MEPAYVIEVLAKYFDKLDQDKQKQVLIHELLHIPKNFSGALLPHRGRNRHLENNANQLFKRIQKINQLNMLTIVHGDDTSSSREFLYRRAAKSATSAGYKR